ncbi:MAG: methyltransferase domain-containing protein [Bacteroidota bacterium]
MNFFRSFIIPNLNPTLKDALNNAASNLFKKLEAVNSNELDVSDYSKKYFSNYQSKLQYSLECGCFILAHSLNHLGDNFTNATILDHGGGLGMLSLLAKSAQIKTVIYNDIYDVSTTDAKKIASLLNESANHYICSDIRELVAELNNKQLSIDCFISRNVIEHIYNLEEFFYELRNVPGKNLTVFIATTANEKNILVDQYTKKLQRKAEFEFSAGKWDKARDAKKPYSILRKEILLEAYPNLQRKELMELVICSRGLIKKDILVMAEKYVKDGIMPNRPSHPSNTCDPYTGNRTENLLPVENYKKYFESNGFSFDVYAGFYNTSYSQKLLNLFTPTVNNIIKKYPQSGISLAPFIGLQGKRNKI